MSEVAYMSEDEIQEDNLVPWRIENDSQADWAVRKIQEAEQAVKRFEAFYAQKMAEIKAQTERDTANLRAALEIYFSGQMHKVTKTQESYSLPSGKLVLKKQQPEFSLDEEKLLPWVKANCPELVKVKESTNWAELKKRVAVDGANVVTADAEIVPGVTVTDRPDVFRVEV